MNNAPLARAIAAVTVLGGAALTACGGSADLDTAVAGATSASAGVGGAGGAATTTGASGSGGTGGAAPGTAQLRVHYPAAGHAITIRGSAGGLSWAQGEPTTASGDTFTIT